MNARLAYIIAALLLISPLIGIPSLYLYRQHQMHLIQERMLAHMETEKAKKNADRLAHQNL